MDLGVEQIDKTYGHLFPDALDRTRVALDAFLTGAKEATPEDAVSGA
jgi:hypothetical protein